ncbi:exodeoxyribonuclease V subunit beta [Acidithiobacillus thiooxidans]|uniref:RecBCD enzyme subunit RecB n=1 Tax=Acidithiobacillus thiooxidans ATCC 19377 TaxID=637390 RepID=A0A5P9XV17_ACITH|nr:MULTISPECIES: exodeoxyribonuclease V subunit beta [Acidithiobacillus]MBU2740767.1 exodeoxyribonuclease V subunit beta [Acidithiobacillus albertensis]MBU2835686.1 exodeoxyribonuclease V subunit beta [Acidithiobacillus thiooxidans]MBU2842491.1 exodeoxyribonuclease V subunit beta [Acidithiobacillus thiooxidans]MDA8177558.1 exodeoxyribonuclease V subunit beta [Acidithiobacillus sp.]QFX97598.1 exodeoxyribonuclease V subunit beta [Acidithiobacillus thiooxidans ATCC 19377]
MSTALNPLEMPLWGSRLIEASAGTGKTWTIAALYLRLILGHGQAGQPVLMPLLPENILVMTFTRAATQELKERIRQRLQEAAAYFREPEQQPADAFLQKLLEDYAEPAARQHAAWRLSLAADAMDQSAIFTIDAWCQRSLREHAFLTGSDLRESLLQDDNDLRADAIRDFWRQEIYPLPEHLLEPVLAVFADPDQVQSKIVPLLGNGATFGQPSRPLQALLSQSIKALQQQIKMLKQRWSDQQADLRSYILQILNGPKADNPLNGGKYKPEAMEAVFEALQDWLDSPEQILPANLEKCQLLRASSLQKNCNKGRTIEVPSSARILEAVLDELETPKAQFQKIHHDIQSHAAAWIQQRLETLKAMHHQVSFHDYQRRLADALGDPARAEQLKSRLQNQYPVAMVDEFQDTSSLQYRIFDAIYATASNTPERLLLLIGDPKQSIYRFRGADIQSYLQARRLTAGRHYQLDTNFRSSKPLVAALNALYDEAEAELSEGAFAYAKAGTDNPLPYWPVRANGKNADWQLGKQPGPALTIWAAAETLNKADYLYHAAEQAAECIVQILTDPETGFRQENAEQIRRVSGRDIAILVRDRHEAACIREALQRRHVRSVFLAEKQSVYDSPEAQQLLLWLEAVADPENTLRLRVALALPLLDLSHQDLDAFNRDGNAWEEQRGSFQDLSRRWRRQGVLAMLHHSIHHFAIARKLLRHPDGERRLTNLLQLGELLQSASATREGPEALIHFLREAIAAGHDQSDAHILRLESDAELIRVVTIHAAKGLQYPLVFLPFIATYRKDKAEDYQVQVEEDGAARIIWERGDSKATERARLQEDLRLLYVALTRAEYALFLGLAAPSSAKSPIFDHSAIAYLLGYQHHNMALPELLKRLQQNAALRENLQIQPLPTETPVTPLVASTSNTQSRIPDYHGHFDKTWGIGSFSLLVRDLSPSAPLSARRARQGAIWHQYPQGMRAGTFLHDQLQALAGQGFATVLQKGSAARITRACEQAGLSGWAEGTLEWLQAIVRTPLMASGLSLENLQHYQSEMAFWFPSAALRSRELDQLCTDQMLPGMQRPRLPDRVLHGMMRGFMDLVFADAGQYFVMDYKSNVLGSEDRDYHEQAMQQQTLQHRYELQASLYQLALHRLLQQRLGRNYDPQAHLGGTLLFYLRGLEGPQRGILHLPANLALIEEMDQLFASGERAS